jgi:glyoxylase-like metal-dependent hydrolase (beta-lactamase superfamily II)/rhodanese-related sulfurtransferase
MYFRQFYLGCLAHASYLIGSKGEAVVVDPQRDVDQYIDEANAQGLSIRYIIETHLHADFVSGHRELAERTGATIVFGAESRAEVDHRAVHDGDELRVGDVVLRAIETPGHTPESVCWLVSDLSAQSEPRRLLTGDTLFIGDVGRPDLAGGRGFTSEQMASMLYDSLHEKILKLDDAVQVWPAHGAGSACGKNISKERSSTIGEQRRLNYALQAMPREAFVEMMTRDLPPAPRYFPMDAEINRRGARPLDEVTAPVLHPEAVREVMASGAVIVDVRESASFAAGHIPGAVSIGLGGQFASWAGTLLHAGDRLVVVAASEEKAREAVMRLARVGLENVIGVMQDDLDSWRASGGDVVAMPRITASDLSACLSSTGVLDVRRRPEYAGGHVPGSINIPLDELPSRLDEVPRESSLAVICASGYRSTIAASILERNGIPPIDVAGGTQGWIASGHQTVA